MKPRSALCAAAQAAVLLMLGTGDAVSQPASGLAYPSKPIRVVLPFAPGGTSDGLARILQPKLGDALGQPLVIDNRPGAGGNIAAEIVAKSAADGYTLYMGSAVLTTSQSLYSKLPFDPVRDFAPITQLATGPYFLVVHPSVPAKNVSELVALAKAKPRGLNYASSGVGVPSHLAAELFNSRAGIEMVHVAYKGGGPAGFAVLAGETQVFFGTGASALPHVKAGRLRALAVTGLQRSVLAPEVPTLDESGFRGFNITTWDSFVAPAGTPKPIIARIYTETVKVLRMADIRERIINIGYEPTGTTPEELAEFLRTESAILGKVIKDANIRAE
jgi:tripartite-type tricarboxylate transporter receptor subunit TctC